MSITKVPISSFCRTTSGGTPLRDKGDLYYGGDIPWVKSGELRESLVTHTEEHITEKALAESSAKIVPAGAILVAMYGATVGRVGLLGVNAATNQAICSIIPDPTKADAKYLFHCLQAEMPQFLSKRNGGAQPNISQEIIRNTKIALPHLEEQRRLAAILDQAQALRAKRRQALAKLDTLTQSLFLDMFGDPIENNRQWPLAKVGDFVAGFETGKSISAPDDLPTSRFQILKISAVTKLEFDSLEVKPLPSDFVPLGKEIVRAGDLLFSRANTSELIGATAYVYSTPDNLVLPDKLWRFVWKDKDSVAPLFVWHLFRQASVRREISGRGTGSSGSMKNISQGKVLDIKLALPPVRQQREFADKLRVIDRGRSIMTAELASLDRMSKSLQHRAFRGEL